MPNPLEHSAPRLAEAPGLISPHIANLTGVFSRLAEQHRELAALLRRAEHASDPDKRRDLWGTIRRELLSHERAELSEVYSVIGQFEAVRDIARRHAPEARELEAAALELDAISCDAPAWASGLRQLSTLLEDHAQEEEHDYFPRAQEALGPTRAQALEPIFLNAQQRILAELT